MTNNDKFMANIDNYRKIFCDILMIGRDIKMVNPKVN
jgi:hypothetical protein